MTDKFSIMLPTSDWTPPVELPDLSTAKTIAIDVETRDPGLKTNGPGWPTGNGEIVGYAIAVEGWSGYLPVAHRGGGNLDKKIVSRWLKKVFESPADKIMHNAQYDAGWIRREGFTLNGRIIDTMLIASLLNENRFSYSLNALSYDYLNKAKSDKELVRAAQEFGFDPKGEMYKLPAMYVGAYGEADAELTLELWNHFSALMTQEDLWGIANLELELLPCLIDMTWRGVRVDMDGVERTRTHLIKREKDVLAEIKRTTNLKVEIWSAKSLAIAFDEAGLEYPTTAETGAPSFTKKFLANHSHPLAKMIVEARNLNKVQGTFINTIMKHCASDGRIHSHINQIRSDDGGTVSGRISMSNPNLQQIPARDPELGPMIRRLFLPEEGQKWAAIDFSQQEPRILVHYAYAFGESKGAHLAGAPEFVEAYRKDPDTDFHSMVAEMASIPRKQAKTINLGMMYGMGVKKLAAELDLTYDEAKTLISQYHERVPFVKGLTNGVTNKLNDRKSPGSIHSILGRKCRFDLWEPHSFEMNKALPLNEAVDKYGATTRLRRAFTYKALNRLIQASAADMTKRAMVNIYRTGRVPLIQIHDEIAMSVDNAEEAREVANIMEEAVSLYVPNKCDVEIGDSWGNAE